ncbi:MAG: class I SAM-dependent methyltransferase [Pseudoxanthomonas sp.]
MPPRHGRYGIDAPYVPAMMALGALACFGLDLLPSLHGLWISGAIIAAMLALYLHTSLRGKFAAWSQVLERAGLRGDEHLLDLGCGRGAVLLMAAQRLPRGQATGIDIWSGRDQSGNAIERTRRNAELEGVAERVTLQTADMRELPFADGSFEVIVSSLAIHNIPVAGQRQRAIDEAWRVLRPCGRLLLADMRHTGAYAQRLQVLGATGLHVRSLGWRTWWGGPWLPTRLVEAVKPGA